MLDVMVMEAVALKVRREDAELQKDAKRKDFRDTSNKKNFEKLNEFR